MIRKFESIPQFGGFCSSVVSLTKESLTRTTQAQDNTPHSGEQQHLPTCYIWNNPQLELQQRAVTVLIFSPNLLDL